MCLGRDQTLPLLLSVDVNTVADGVRVPRNSLEGIWSKAVELLKTEGAIVLLLVLVMVPSLSSATEAETHT